MSSQRQHTRTTRRRIGYITSINETSLNGLSEYLRRVLGSAETKLQRELKSLFLVRFYFMLNAVAIITNNHKLITEKRCLIQIMR